MQAGSSSELSVILSLAHAVGGDARYTVATVSGETLQNHGSSFAQRHLSRDLTYFLRPNQESQVRDIKMNTNTPLALVTTL